MKKIALLFAAILPLAVAAQEIKIGYINTNEVMMLMPEINDIEKQMADFAEQNRKYLQDMQTEIQTKVKAYEAEKANLSESIRSLREEELYSMQERLQTTYQTLQQEAQTKQQNLLKPVQDKLRAAIETVGQKNNFFLIFESESGLLYKSPKAVDATPLVKKELGIL